MKGTTTGKVTTRQADAVGQWGWSLTARTWDWQLAIDSFLPIWASTLPGRPGYRMDGGEAMDGSRWRRPPEDGKRDIPGELAGILGSA